MTGFRFVLELVRSDGTTIGHAPLSPDWEPALECARFQAVRRGLLPVLTGTASGTIEPVWHGELGEPYVGALRAGAAGAAVECEVPIAYVEPLARQAVASLLRAGVVAQGEQVSFLICAFAAAPGAAGGEGAGGESFAVEDLVEALPLAEGALAEFLAASRPHPGECAGDTDDVPVFVPQRVLDEACALARRAGDVETGGILVGRLRRDSRRPEIFIEVTGQIPARHTVAQRTRLTFTADTWDAARDAIALRRASEQMVGWWHYHPDFCSACPAANRATCPYRSTFFSLEDMHLHRTCFGSAFGVGLLLSASAEPELSVALYGWRSGMVAERGFRILEEPRRSNAR